MLAATCTVFLSPKKPAAEALMSADPRLTPVTVGCWAGVVCPCAIVGVDSTTAVVGDVTLAVANPGLKPFAIAVIVVLPAPLPVRIVMLTPDMPSGTVAFAGTEAIVPLLLSRKTIWPPGPATL